MARGDVDVRVVENPTAATVDTALAASLAATDLSGAHTITNLGQHIMITTVGGLDA